MPPNPGHPRLQRLNNQIRTCARCPRLRAYCAAVARQKRAAFRDQTYYGRPVPNFGDPAARLLIVGLAPAAHGGNRTGRMFTGDRSGDWLYDALFTTGFCNQPTSTHLADGLQLHGAMITAALHCAPPANRPTTQELVNCQRFIDATFDLLTNLRAVVCLGRVAFDAVLKRYQRGGWITSRAPYRFAHGAEHRLTPCKPRTDHPVTVLCSYHPSQQNTFTGKLTREMFLKVFRRARGLAEMS